jgi:hypothetical protein
VNKIEMEHRITLPDNFAGLRLSSEQRRGEGGDRQVPQLMMWKKRKIRADWNREKGGAYDAAHAYFSTPSIFSRPRTTPSMRTITRRGKKPLPPRASIASRSASSSVSAEVTLNRSRCSRHRRARLRARALRCCWNSRSSARGSARVIRARRSESLARGRREKYERFEREARVSSK